LRKLPSCAAIRAESSRPASTPGRFFRRPCSARLCCLARLWAPLGRRLLPCPARPTRVPSLLSPARRRSLWLAVLSFRFSAGQPGARGSRPAAGGENLVQPSDRRTSTAMLRDYLGDDVYDPREGDAPGDEGRHALLVGGVVDGRDRPGGLGGRPRQRHGREL